MRAKPHSEQEIVDKIVDCMGEIRTEWRTFVATLSEYAEMLKTDIEKEDLDMATSTFSRFKLFVRNRTTEAGKLGDKMTYWKKELTKFRAAQEKK